MNRKLTAWKKNRKFGDVAGGREWPKFEDRIIRRSHPLKRPAIGEKLPILIEENPSREFFFPITGEEALSHLSAFPAEDTDGITHLWLRRIKTRTYRDPDQPFAAYAWGSGVHAIILYPWPKDCLLRFGERQPPNKTLNDFSRWTSELVREGNLWCLRWTEEALRDFYLKLLIGHEVGHHRDPKRFSKANSRQREDSADQYALMWLPKGEKFISGWDKV